MSIGDKIKALRARGNLTLEEVAKYVKVSRQTINRYENNIITNIPSDKIELLASLFNTTPAYLMGWEEESPIPQYENIIPVPEMHQIPLYTGGIACGDPLFVSDETEYISVPKHIKADFAVVCKGDSMINARINDGDIVYIKQQPTVNDGQIAAVLIDDSATLKKVYLEKNRLTLMAANPDYPPRIFTGEELENIKILGLATAFTSSI